MARRQEDFARHARVASSTPQGPGGGGGVTTSSRSSSDDSSADAAMLRASEWAAEPQWRSAQYAEPPPYALMPSRQHHMQTAAPPEYLDEDMQDGRGSFRYTNLLQSFQDDGHVNGYSSRSSHPQHRHQHQHQHQHQHVRHGALHRHDAHFQSGYPYPYHTEMDAEGEEEGSDLDMWTGAWPTDDHGGTTAPYRGRMPSNANYDAMQAPPTHWTHSRPQSQDLRDAYTADAQPLGELVPSRTTGPSNGRATGDGYSPSVSSAPGLSNGRSDRNTRVVASNDLQSASNGRTRNGKASRTVQAPPASAVASAAPLPAPAAPIPTPTQKRRPQAAATSQAETTAASAAPATAAATESASVGGTKKKAAGKGKSSAKSSGKSGKGKKKTAKADEKGAEGETTAADGTLVVVPAKKPKKRVRYLRDTDRRNIIKRIENGEKQAALAREFGVTRAAICHIKKNRFEILTRYDLLVKQAQEMDRAENFMGPPGVEQMVIEVRASSVLLLMTTLRDSRTGPTVFRRAAGRLIMILLEEALAMVGAQTIEVVTATGSLSYGLERRDEFCGVAIGAEGFPFLVLFHQMEPAAPQGSIHIETALDRHGRRSWHLDHMDLPRDVGRYKILLFSSTCGTGAGECKAIEALCNVGAQESSISLVVILCASDGLVAIGNHFPGVRIFTGAIDGEVDRRSGAIIPGLGDFVSRYNGE